MSRKFIATILAASLAVTSVSAVPARADNRDLARFLAGATALIIIGSALSDNNGRVTVRHGDASGANRPRPGDRFGDRHDHDRGHHANRRKPLPAYCRSSVWTPQGRQSFLDGRCLRQNYSQARDLPQQCRITAGQGPDHKRRGYSIRCLKRNGFEIARN